MNSKELFDSIESAFPLCIFIYRGKKIIISPDSMHKGVKAFNFTEIGFPYECGIHHEIVNFLKHRGFFSELDDKGEMVIKEDN